MERRNEADQPRRSQRNVRVRALLSLGLVLGLGAVGTLAAWTDNATATATFTAGSMDLKLRQVSPSGTAADSVALTSLGMTTMYPGVSKAALIEVANSGTIPLGYSIAGSATPATGLGAALTVSTYAGGTATNSSTGTPTGTCSGTLIGTANLPLVGTLLAAPGRTLAAGATEQLCVRISLPTTADTAAQGTSTNAVLTFTGTQGS